MVERYVVAIDGSAPSEAALEWAIKRAVREPAPVVLATVHDDEFGAMGREVEDIEARQSARLVSEVAARVRRRLPAADISVAVLEGSVPWALARYVRPSDLLVIGTHKSGFLHGRVLGSRSVQIAAAAPCGVAVVPLADLRFRTGVVAGIDRMQTAGALGAIAAREATARGQELLLLQSVPVPPEGTTVARDRLALAHAVAAAKAACPALVIRSRVTHRPAADALLDAARDKALLLLGPGSSDAARTPIGSVLHEVLLNVNAPVLVARPLAVRELEAVASHDHATLERTR